MKQTLLVLALMLSGLSFSCKDSAKEEEVIQRQIEEIESVEQTLDSTVTDVHKKAEEAVELIKELDSI